MRTFLVLLAGLCCAGGSAGIAEAALVPAQVRVSVDVDGAGPAAARTVSLRCPSARQRAACRVLGDRALLRGVPGDRACSMVYGGPQTATVTGRVAGRPLRAAFARNDGCEIARWRRALPLLSLAR